MTPLDIFALVILAVLVLAAVAAWVVLAMLPGRIARQRRHPQAAAISACGWWGAITLGLLSPLAYIWAYTDPRWREREPGADAASNDQPEGLNR
jgi:hypothetical protein